MSVSTITARPGNSDIKVVGKCHRMVVDSEKQLAINATNY
jgi:hypothetical protein